MAEKAKETTQDGAGESETTTETTDQTIGEIQDTVTPPKKKEGEAETVPLATFLDLKKENKEMTKALKELEKKISEGATKVEITDDIAAIAEEFEVDPAFVQRLQKLTEARAMAVAKEAATEQMKPLQEKERADAIDKAFEKHFKAAIEKVPEFKAIVNPDVIKQLSLNPANKDKTFVQLIEETYGNAVTGRRTIETTKPGGGKEPQTLDVARARKDPEYFAEIMADPAMKEKYNQEMLKSGV